MRDLSLPLKLPLSEPFPLWFKQEERHITGKCSLKNGNLHLV